MTAEKEKTLRAELCLAPGFQILGSLVDNSLVLQCPSFGVQSAGPTTHLTWISADANIVVFFSSITHFTLQRIVLVELELTHTFTRKKTTTTLHSACAELANWYQPVSSDKTPLTYLDMHTANIVTEILKPFVFSISELPGTSCHNSTGFARMVRSWTSVSRKLSSWTAACKV